MLLTDSIGWVYPIHMKSLIGEKLKRIRKQHNFSQEKMARLAGISKGYIHHVEARGIIPSLEFALKIEVGCGLRKPEISLIILRKAGLDQRAIAKLLSTPPSK